jgi:hypothetical protein
MSQVSRVLRQAQKQPYLVRDAAGVDVAAKAMLTDRVAPVIACSCVTGDGLDRLRALLGMLQPRALTVSDRSYLDEAAAIVSGAPRSVSAHDGDVDESPCAGSPTASGAATSAATDAEVTKPELPLSAKVSPGGGEPSPSSESGARCSRYDHGARAHADAGCDCLAVCLPLGCDRSAI